MALLQKIINLGFILSAKDSMSKDIDVVNFFQNERKSKAMEFTLLPRCSLIYPIFTLLNI